MMRHNNKNNVLMLLRATHTQTACHFLISYYASNECDPFFIEPMKNTKHIDVARVTTSNDRGW